MKKELVMLGTSEKFVERSCRWEHPDSPIDSCLHERTSNGFEVKFCRTCDLDACNGSLKLKAMTLLVFSAVVANLARM